MGQGDMPPKTRQAFSLLAKGIFFFSGPEVIILDAMFHMQRFQPMLVPFLMYYVLALLSHLFLYMPVSGGSVIISYSSLGEIK